MTCCAAGVPPSPGIAGPARWLKVLQREKHLGVPQILFQGRNSSAMLQKSSSQVGISTDRGLSAFPGRRGDGWHGMPVQGADSCFPHCPP